MRNRIFGLSDIIKLADNEALSEKYVKYLCGLDEDRQYKHREITDIRALTEALPESADLSGFIFGYVVPQLNKEFDLLKITDGRCLNIELKSEHVSEEKIREQLIKNRHFLKLLGKEQCAYFTFVSDSGTFYKLCNDEVVKTTADEAAKYCDGKASAIDLDAVFMPKNVLVSPLNDPDKFLSGDYLLTQHQQDIEDKIISYVKEGGDGRFIGLTGGPGTGKTLLIYDFVKKYGPDKKMLLVHSGMLCNGHYALRNALQNVKIISANELNRREIEDVDTVVVDEAHRLYEEHLEKIEKWVKKSRTVCLFSYDNMQKLSKAENLRKISESIARLCGKHIYKLTNKIRTNKELDLFITCLFDLSKYRKEYAFPNVKLLFEPNAEKAVERAKNISENEDYTYISYTPSRYYPSLDYQVGEFNTHEVIGQEFENVCMILDDNFYYKNNTLMGKEHPNPDYIFTKLLYQGLTRVRSKLALIVTSEELLSKIITLFE